MRVRGFTLIEVLVALAVVTFGMAAVLAAITSAADTTAYLRERSFAEWVAMNRIVEVRLQARRPAEGKSAGEAEFAGRRWRWEQEITELEFDGLHRIDVRVRPDEGTRAGVGRAAAWIANVSGIVGDALVQPDGQVLDWSGRGQRQGPGPQRPPSADEPPTVPPEGEDGAGPPPQRPDTQ